MQNLYHDLVTGHAMTRILHLMNQTPIEWYCIKQATVAMATYSLEFITTQSMMDQIIDLHYALHMMSVPLDYHPTKQSSQLNSKLMKGWNILRFHHVRESVASGFLQLYHILRNGKSCQSPLEDPWIP